MFNVGGSEHKRLPFCTTENLGKHAYVGGEQ